MTRCPTTDHLSDLESGFGGGEAWMALKRVPRALNIMLGTRNGQHRSACLPEIDSRCISKAKPIPQSGAGHQRYTAADHSGQGS